MVMIAAGGVGTMIVANGVKRAVLRALAEQVGAGSWIATTA